MSYQKFVDGIVKQLKVGRFQGLEEGEVRAILNTVFRQATKVILDEGELIVDGFGRFFVRTLAGRTVAMPDSIGGGSYTVPSRAVVKFRAAKMLRTMEPRSLQLEPEENTVVDEMPSIPQVKEIAARMCSGSRWPEVTAMYGFDKKKISNAASLYREKGMITLAEGLAITG